MNSDKAIEELFLAQTPHFTDGDAFMASLTKRLDAVEYLKQYQERTIRRYKLAMVAAYVVGIISGVVAIFLLPLTPSPQFLAPVGMPAGLLLWLTENFRFITTTALSLLMTVGIFSIINNVQDIMEMRLSMNEPAGR